MTGNGDRRKLLSHVDASGFPFQMRVEHEVRGLGNLVESRWEIVGTEVPWEDPRSGASGFVDLVIQRPPIFFVIECKRRTGGAWTFLSATAEMPNRRHFRFCYTGRNRVQVKDGVFDPESPESEYCVVPGSGEGRKRTLERIASELVVATESIAEKHRKLREGQPFVPMAFIPMIVCTPPPAIALFATDRVSLEDGTVGEDARIESVQHVRFRKSLARFESEDTEDVSSLRDVAADRERTVLVISAEALAGYLRGLWHLKPEHLFMELMR